jgi:pimeloyl-ACP methyl ester carboxylesterase
VLSVWSGPWSACFAIESDEVSVLFDFVDGQVRSGDGTALFTLAAPGTIWAKFLLPVPPRHHHGIFPMMYRVLEFAIGGSTVARIDTNRCRLFMLTGENDYSRTVEMSAATVAQIPGVKFQAMNGIGHFPFAENPTLFAECLRPILDELDQH